MSVRVWVGWMPADSAGLSARLVLPSETVPVVVAAALLPENTSRILVPSGRTYVVVVFDVNGAAVAFHDKSSVRLTVAPLTCSTAGTEAFRTAVFPPPLVLNWSGARSTDVK